MPKFDYKFDIESCGDDRMVRIASGYDPAISISIRHDTNWWISLIHKTDGDYVLDIQIGNHNAVLFDADRDGMRGIDEDRLELTAKGRYPVTVLAQAVALADAWSHKIIYGMDALYQAIEEA